MIILLCSLNIKQFPEIYIKDFKLKMFAELFRYIFTPLEFIAGGKNEESPVS